MEVKSILVGAGLVIVGGLLGFVLASKHCGMHAKMGCGFNSCRKMNEQGFHNKKFAGEHHQFFKETLTDELALTAEQQTKIDEIFETKKEQHKASRKEHREKMQEEMSKTHAEIKAILTPEQQTKFDELKNEMFPFCDRE